MYFGDVSTSILKRGWSGEGQKTASVTVFRWEFEFSFVFSEGGGAMCVCVRVCEGFNCFILFVNHDDFLMFAVVI